MRGYVYVVIALWSFSTLSVVTMAVAVPQESQQFVEAISNQMKPLLSDSSFTLMLNIFVNNTRACLLEVGLGLGLGLIPLLIVFVNGIAMGLVIALALAQTGPLFLAVALLPHGIIEIPV